MFTDPQREEFLDLGFIRMPGALPAELSTVMVRRIWETLGERHGIEPQEADSWIEGGVRGIGDLNREAAFRPFGSPAITATIDGFLGPGQWRVPASWGQILVTFPAPQWSWNSLFQGEVEVTTIPWHTDYPYDTPPGKLSGVQIFCLLADVDSGGGGTLVLQGSHRLIHRFVQGQPAEVLGKMKRARRAFLESDPWLQSLTRATSMARPDAWLAERQTVIGGIPVKVAELTGKAGDVYFTHPWLLHSISPNCNATPRMMCTQRIYRAGGGAP